MKKKTLLSWSTGNDSDRSLCQLRQDLRIMPTASPVETFGQPVNED